MKTLFYLKSIIRKIISKPLYPAISTFGLTIGFVSIVLVTVWIRDELSYDAFQKNSDRLYRLTVEMERKSNGFHWDFARNAIGWLQNIKKEIPGVESMVMISRWEAGCVKAGNNVWNEELFFADPSLTDVFTLQFTKGDPKTSLAKPWQVVISESMAHKLFGNEDALGKTIYLYCSRCTDKKPYQVTGVFKDTPVNSHIHFNIVASREKPVDDDTWCYNYLLLQKNTSPDDILRKFKSFASKYVKPEDLPVYKPHLQKITDIHLYSSKDRELEKNGSVQQVYFVVGLALFVLFITLFNFFTIRYVSLVKEFKSSQVFRFSGANTKNMYGYQALEALLYGLISAIIAYFIIKLAYPKFNQLIGKHEFAGISFIEQTSLICLFILVLIAEIAGLLPYWAFRISQSLKAKKAQRSTLSFSRYSASGSRSGVLKTLLGLQYVSTFVLIICVIVINDQLMLFSKYQLGNNRQKTLCIKDLPCQVVNKYQLFKEELLQNPLIADVTSSMENPGTEIEDMMWFDNSDGTRPKLIYVCPVDDNFFSFYNLKLKAGMSFPKFTGNDSIAETYVLNEKASEMLGYKKHEDAIYKPLRRDQDKTPGRIVGVVSNFQPSSVTKEIKPYVFFQKSFWLFSVQIKYDTARQAQCLNNIRSTWDKIYPDYPMSYTFVDDLYKSVYKNEYQLRKIGSALCLLAIILSALGLFGITGIVYEARTKEIGIRKVNGARFTQIAGWLLKDIFAIVTIALIVATPLAWYLMHTWLQNYAYKVTVTGWVFLLAGIIISFIALSTVSWQTWRAATRNPVESLRYE
jgi:ABC-type antimicrobial peptide transport system, permease component